MQVAYLEAFLNIDRLTSRDAASFVAWLSRIARNTLRDAIKGLEREKRPNPARRVRPPSGRSSSDVLIELLGATRSTPSRCAARDEAIRLMETGLEDLPEDYRKVVQHCDLEGRPVAEVAAGMGRSVGAVHMLRARAHERLRQRMGSTSQFFSDGA